MKEKKKRGRVIQLPLSPIKYIQTRARQLPVYECLITEKWLESGMANIIVARRHSNGHITCGFYLVDLLCLGVKDTFHLFNIPPFKYEEIKERYFEGGNMVRCDYPLAHNIIYGANAFAEDYGFKPHKDYEAVTRFLLEDDDEAVEFIDVEFGEEGMPCVLTGFGDDHSNVISQLDKTAGEGNYKVVYMDINDFNPDEEWES